MEEEKNRKLSAKEQRRLNVFEATCERLLEEGYKKTNLTIGIVKANLFVLLLAIPVVAIGVLLFVWRNPIGLLRPTPYGSLWFIVLFVLLIVVHELLHLGRFDALHCSGDYSCGIGNPVGFASLVLDGNHHDSFGGR